MISVKMNQSTKVLSAPGGTASALSQHATPARLLVSTVDGGAPACGGVDKAVREQSILKVAEGPAASTAGCPCGWCLRAPHCRWLCLTERAAGCAGLTWLSWHCIEQLCICHARRREPATHYRHAASAVQGLTAECRLSGRMSWGRGSALQRASGCCRPAVLSLPRGRRHAGRAWSCKGVHRPSDHGVSLGGRFILAMRPLNNVACSARAASAWRTGHGAVLACIAQLWQVIAFDPTHPGQAVRGRSPPSAGGMLELLLATSIMWPPCTHGQQNMQSLDAFASSLG